MLRRELEACERALASAQQRGEFAHHVLAHAYLLFDARNALDDAPQRLVDARNVEPRARPRVEFDNAVLVLEATGERVEERKVFGETEARGVERPGEVAARDQHRALDALDEFAAQAQQFSALDLLRRQIRLALILARRTPRARGLPGRLSLVNADEAARLARAHEETLQRGLAFGRRARQVIDLARRRLLARAQDYLAAILLQLDADYACEAASFQVADERGQTDVSRVEIFVEGRGPLAAFGHMSLKAAQSNRSFLCCHSPAGYDKLARIQQRPRGLCPKTEAVRAAAPGSSKQDFRRLSDFVRLWRHTLLRGIFRTKNLDDILKTAGGPQFSLKRTLGAFNVTLIGIGAIIGAGIFATVGSAAAGDMSVGRPGAGASLMLSFVITAVVCGFTALCYAELASMVPISGSAYTYSYATMGELIAWIIGWDLIIEYAIGNVAVAISWAEYFHKLLLNLGVDFPHWLASDYRSARLLASSDPDRYAALFGDAPVVFGVPLIFNLLAFGIVALITIVLVWGIRESANFNAGMVAVKILVLVFFVAVALYFVPPSQMAANWRPFQPQGWAGTFSAAALVFFAYIGFDAVSTVAEETKNPARDLPIGIIASLVVCTVFYVIVAAVFTGLMSFNTLQTVSSSAQAEALTMALDHVAPPDVRWPSTVVAFGSVVAHTAVLLVFQLGQPRIFFSMARDGLLPPVFASVHPRFKTPHVTTILTGLFVGGIAAFANIESMLNLTNIGTLFAFVLVCIGIPILRRKDPDRPRPFRVPFGAWLLPVLGAASCIFLMSYLTSDTWWRFIGWLVLGVAVYLAYGYTRSAIGREVGRPTRTPLMLKLAAVGFLTLAVGLFTVPHDLGLSGSLSAATDSSAAQHTRSLIGYVLIVVGLVVGIVGTVLGAGAERGTAAEG